MNARVLVVAAHPDDEALGCGGTLARLSADGSAVHVVFLADGVSARRDVPHGASPEVLSERRAAASKACALLGVGSHSFGDLPDNRLDAVPLLDVIRPIEALIDQHRPDTVITHHGSDLNVDHRRVSQAVATACRPQRGHCVRRLLMFEVASSTEWQLPDAESPFAPNFFVDISTTLERKLAALQAYSAEMRPWPHPRSLQALEHLARWRGATVGVDAAEAFVLGRQIW